MGRPSLAPSRYFRLLLVEYFEGIDSERGIAWRATRAPHNLSAPVDQQIYLRALRTIPNLSITYGHFLTHSVRMALSGVNPAQRVWVDKTEEKGSDVNLAAHLFTTRELQ
jgi:hypothetical protein